MHLFRRENAGPAKKPFLTDSRQPVGHSFTFFALKDNHCSTGK
jgi:hypothetical protein